MWVGIVYLLRNIGIIQIVDWNIIWPVLVIIAGSSLKHCKPWMMHGMGGKCGMGGCGKCGGDGHKCEGPDCNVCKK